MMLRLENYLINKISARRLPGLFSFAVLCVGIFITAVLWRHLEQDEETKLRTVFNSSADMAVKNIYSRLEGYTVVIRGVKGFLDGTDEISFDEFKNYVQALNVPQKLPGIQDIGIMFLVSHADKARHTTEIRKQNFPDYKITPEGDRDFYTPIERVEPLTEENLKALGFDTQTVPEARLAMEQSRDRDDVAITSRIRLVQDADKPGTFAFVMYLPIYKKDMAHDTLEARRNAIKGWVDVPFRMKSLMEGLRGEFDSDLELEIHDSFPPSEQSNLYHSAEILFNTPVTQGNLQTTRRLDIGGRQWTLLLRTTPVFQNRLTPDHYAQLMALGALLITLSLSVMTWLLSKGRYTALSQFRQLFDQAGDGILLLTNNYQFIDANAAALKLLGYSHAELLNLRLPQILAQTELPRLASSIGKIMAGNETLEEWSYQRKDGSELAVEVSARNLDNNRYFAILHDLTSRKKAEQRIQRLTHLYQALSETNQAIVRMANESDLFPLVCQCAVDFGGMKMAWIGQLDASTSSITPVSSYGAGIDYLDGIQISADGNLAEGRGPTGTALRENQPTIINNYLANPITKPWHERAKKYGWKSAATFPIQRNGKPFAVFNVYHAQANAFDKEAIKLLNEMAKDVSFALDNFDRENLRKQTENALIESEAKMSAILENVSAYIYLKDSDGRYLYVNRPVLDLWETTMDEVIGFGDEKFFDAETTTQIQMMDQKVLKAGQTIQQEDVNTILKTGKVATYWTIKIPLYREDGSIYALCGISTDISERKQAEMLLREGEARYRLLFTANPVPMWVYDLDTLDFIAVNDAAVSQYGYSREEFLAMTITNLQPDKTTLPDRDAANDGQYRTSDTCQLRTKDGRLVWVEMTGHALNFEGRNAEIVLAHDVTARIETEQQLHLNAQVFESSREGIMITDTNNHIISVNRAYTEISGYSAEEAIGKNPRLISSGQQGKEFYHAMWHDILSRGHWQGEVTNRRKNGESYPQWLSVSVIRNQAGQIIYHIGILSDLSEHRAAQERIQFLSHFDALTKLPNRVLLRDRTQLAITTAKREHTPVSLMYIDLDRFKIINDSLGQNAGDQILKELAFRFTSHLHNNDTLCRQGGDEFILLLPNINGEGAAHVARRMLDLITQPFFIDGHRLNLTASVGIAEFPQDGDNFEQLAQSADAALFRAKQKGRNNYQFFTPQMHAQAREVLQIENELRRALEQNELLLHYQPQVDAKTLKITGAEALIRWQHPSQGMIPPGRFIPIAEESSLIIDIGQWVLHTAICQAASWQEQGLPIVPVAVNLSVVQFRQESFYQTVADALQASSLEPAMLELELTEGIAMENSDRTIQVLDQLNALGVALAIDDFGTGYSSLSYLKRFRVDKLKIDQSFVRDLGQNPEDAAIVTAIISMAQSLGFKTIAEGVETQAQLDFLRAKACDEIQGYLFSKPIPAVEFAKLLANGGDWQVLPTKTKTP